MNVLTEFFDIVSKIALDTAIDLHLQSHRMRDGSNVLYWYIGDSEEPTAGDLFDRIYTDDLDEDKLIGWVDQLKVLYYDHQFPDYPERDYETAEETLEEIERAENAVLDEQERR